MKYIVIGGTGLLGKALKKEISSKDDICITIARKNADYCIDVQDDLKLQALIEEQTPDVVINACAIVNHKICDENPAIAYKTNARPSAILTNLAITNNFKYVYISTDGYFHGDKNARHSETANVLLLNEYARTKYTGEQFTLTNPHALVVRTNIVGFKGTEEPTFVEWVINSLKNNKEITLFDDYYTSSISVTQFSKALCSLIKKDAYGIINLASSEVFSKKEFIEKLANEFNFSLKNTHVGSVSLLSSKRADSLGLDVSLAEKILGYNLPTLNDVILQLKKEYENVQ